MSKEQKMSEQEKNLLKKVYTRWLLTNSTGWNYEKMMGLGYVSAMMPAIDEIYTDPEEKHQIIGDHLQFFNSNNATSTVILGADIAMERELGIEAKDSVVALKTGMMGALAGIGDTIFGMLPGTILGALAGYMALEGNPIGVYFYTIYTLIKVFISWLLMKVGYSEGIKLVSTMSGKLNSITSAANALGIMVIGGLVPTVVSASVVLEYTKGDVVLGMQDTLDAIMPGLVPLLIVLFSYWCLGKKHINSVRLIFILMGLGIVLSVLGVM